MSSRGEELVHENQNHEYFEVKGGGRQRLRHFDSDFPSCMRKTKKEQHPEDDPQSMDERKRRKASHLCSNACVVYFAP